MKLHNSEENFYSIKPTDSVRRATVPADIGGTVADPTTLAQDLSFFFE